MAVPESTFILCLLGPFAAQVDGAPLSHLRSRKGHSLLALLALHYERPLDRSWLAATLWPDASEINAHYNLRRTLADLRRALGPHASRLRSPTPRSLALDLSHADVDLLAFDAAVAQGEEAALRKAVALYRGPLLAGCQEEWVFAERTCREAAYLGALEALAGQARARGDRSEAERHLRLAVATDALRESAHRALMELLAEKGEQAAALRLYQELRRRLHQELNSEPDPETTALFQRLREAARHTGAAGDPRPTTDRGRIPPSVTVSASPGPSLPIPPTPLIGRERERGAAAALLDRRDVRLLTLTGPAGVGKTRLALQIALDRQADYAEGVLFVDLTPLRDPRLVIATIARALGVRETAGWPLIERVRQYLDGKRILLVLDNFEQVVQAAAEVAALLGGAAGSQVVVTSRAVLRLRGEQEFRVPPLALPDLRHLPAPEALAHFAAVELFIQRALNVKPEFAVTNENARAVAAICHRLDGLPLAIERAAVRLKLVTPDALLDRLVGASLVGWRGDRTSLHGRPQESPLQLLTGGPRDLPARQQTLRDAIAWSYDLLTVPEQTLFRRLSVFVGGCTLEAAEAVCDIGGDLHLPVMDGLASLLDQSLLRQIEPHSLSAGQGGGPRFLMLETVREFGIEQLEGSGEAGTIRREHARYFLGLAEEATPGGPIQWPPREWLGRMEVEHDNLRAALLWSHQESTARDTEQRLVAALDMFWMDRGYWREKEQWLGGALARGGPADRGPEDAGETQSLSSCKIGVQGAPSGELDRGPLATWGKLLLAARRYEESIAIWRQLGDRFWLARALASWGNNRSMSPCEEAVSLFREIGDRWELVYALHFLGNAAVAEGAFPQARSHFEESLALAREIGDPAPLARPLAGLAQLAWEIGDYEAARSYSEETVALRREQDDAWLPHCLNGLGQAAAAQGDFAEAARAFEEALAIGRDRSLPQILIGALVGLGLVAWNRGELEPARAHGEEGLTLAEREADRQGIARALLLLGRVAQSQGDGDMARALLRRSLWLCHELMKRREIAERLEELAEVDRGQGQLVRATRLLGVAAAVRDTYGPPVPPIDRVKREHQVAALRAALDEHTFTVAWTEAQGMDVEDAVAYAVEEADTSPGDGG